MSTQDAFDAGFSIKQVLYRYIAVDRAIIAARMFSLRAVRLCDVVALIVVPEIGRCGD